jgi:hypothetical protein
MPVVRSLIWIYDSNRWLEWRGFKPGGGRRIFKDGQIQGTSPLGGILSSMTRVVNLLHVKEPQAPRGPLSKIIGHFPSKGFGRGLAMSWSLIQGVLPIVNRLDQETAKRRGPTRAVEPFKKKKNRYKETRRVQDDSWEACGEVRLNPLGTQVVVGPIAPAPADRWVWNSLKNENW